MKKTLLLACLCLLAVCAGPLFASAPDTTASVATPRVHALKMTILSTMLADEGIGEWGFAALVEVDGHKILFDTGARPETVLQNARELKIDLGDVQDVVLSHHHSDHTTGLMTLRRELAKTHPQALSRVHVGAGIFLPRRGRTSGNIMIAVKKEFEAGGGTFIVYDKPQQILPGVWLTGPVPRVYPEKNYPQGIEVEQGSQWVDDNLPEDESLVFDTDKGFVLLSGCGHSGIVNTLQYAQTFLRSAPVYAAIGGFHLFDATEERLAWTAGKLKEFHVAQILGAHCTGIESVFRLRQLLGLTRRTCVVATIGAMFDLASGIRTGAIAT
jgi:7,8-dihydropterin-6-yl-methyl-4-(beta-D-ribofuranosyl)aminobenzene 5'-phosphate synthase